MLGFPRFVQKLPAKRFYATNKTFKAVSSVLKPEDQNTLKGFKVDAPIRLKKIFKDVPAAEKWFTGYELEEPAPISFRKRKARRQKALDRKIQEPQLKMDYLEQFGDSVVPLELTRTTRMKVFENSRLRQEIKTTFERFEAPLSLLLSDMSKPDETSENRVYLAQHSLADLPAAMQADLPTPAVISQLGKGDIYGSSLWMGRAPTRTPLHRDPNPNLFIQLVGSKTFRLLRPDVGKVLFEQVRAEIGKSGGTANMRGEEMMQGEEREAMEKAIWNDQDREFMKGTALEVKLRKGDGLYIPLGWWHSVRSSGKAINASANWWFR